MSDEDLALHRASSCLECDGGNYRRVCLFRHVLELLRMKRTHSRKESAGPPTVLLSRSAVGVRKAALQMQQQLGVLHRQLLQPTNVLPVNVR